MKIVADKAIPFLKGVFERVATVEYFSGCDITPQRVKDTDILIVRTRTKCNENLLAGSKVRVVASATIGTDHIDLEWCRANNIEVINAPGCNSGGVMQYFITALLKSLSDKELGMCFPEHNFTVGVIGVGHVGTKVAAISEIFGFDVLRYDPPKERQQTLAYNQGYLRLTDFKDYYSLDYLLENSDVVTLHVPLTPETRGLASRDFFAKMKPGAIFINTSRGEVVDPEALLEYKGRLGAIILDVWPGEPEPDRDLLQAAYIATPHIAGYSAEGKINGTSMVVEGITRFLSDNNFQGSDVIEESAAEIIPQPAPVLIPLTELDGLSLAEIAEKFTAVFPIEEMSMSLKEHPEEFESLRNNYNYRHEINLCSNIV